MSERVTTASVSVEVDPDTAFRIFTEQIGTWWRPRTVYWIDSDRGQKVVLEPFVGGRFYEVYDHHDTSTIGLVTLWEPGSALGLTWQENSDDETRFTDVDVRFVASDSGTLVTVVHSGWERLGDDAGQGYSEGWTELLGWFADEAV